MKNDDYDDYWERNGIEKPQQVVVCAACRCGDVIVAGARHFDRVMLSQIDIYPEEIRPMGDDWEQGFIDQFGAFLTREEAMEVVKKSGQPFDAERNGPLHCLFSEGLY
jgi:hypothetical protein